MTQSNVEDLQKISNEEKEEALGFIGSKVITVPDTLPYYIIMCRYRHEIGPWQLHMMGTFNSAENAKSYLISNRNQRKEYKVIEVMLPM